MKERALQTVLVIVGLLFLAAERKASDRNRCRAPARRTRRYRPVERSTAAGQEQAAAPGRRCRQPGLPHHSLLSLSHPPAGKLATRTRRHRRKPRHPRPLLAKSLKDHHYQYCKPLLWSRGVARWFR